MVKNFSRLYFPALEVAGMSQVDMIDHAMRSLTSTVQTINALIRGAQFNPFYGM